MPPRPICVSQAAIAEGRRGDCSGCPIALAAVDAGYSDPRVHGRYLDEWGRDADGFRVWLRTWLLPEPARKFVWAFDSGQYVWPMEFTPIRYPG